MVNIINLLVTDINIQKELHCFDDILLDEGMLFNIVLVVKFLVKFITTYTSQIIAAQRKEHRIQIFFCSFNCNRLTRHKYRINSRKSIFFCRFFAFSTLFCKTNIFTLKTVNDYFRIQRFILFRTIFIVRISASFKFYYTNRLYVMCNKFINIMQMQTITSAEKLFIFASFSIFDYYCACKNFIYQSIATF